MTDSGISTAGFSPPTESAPLGVPIGLELMGKPWRDLELLDIAERLEAVLQARREPMLDEIAGEKYM